MVTALQVKDLRAKTGAGMMDCKKALNETGGDFEEAVKFLRTKGLAAAAKKAGRVAAEGLTTLVIKDLHGGVLELNSETDFVARNENFQELIAKIDAVAPEYSDVESLKEAKLADGKTVNETIVEGIATIGENLTLRRVDNISLNNGVIASYIHNSVAPNMGQISVLVGLESEGDKAKLSELGRQIAMHVAAARPLALTEAELDQELVEKEKDVFAEQARSSGKPENIIEKMIEGRIRKYVEEVVLLEQIFVVDGKTKIKDLIKAAEKEVGAPIKLQKFIRFELGEGVEKDEKNFAEEVAAVTQR